MGVPPPGPTPCNWHACYCCALASHGEEMFNTCYHLRGQGWQFVSLYSFSLFLPFKSLQCSNLETRWVTLSQIWTSLLIRYNKTVQNEVPPSLSLFLYPIIRLMDRHFPTHHRLTLNTLQMRADDSFKISPKLSKMSKLWNYMTIFGITIRNALKWVQTCLLLV